MTHECLWECHTTPFRECARDLCQFKGSSWGTQSGDRLLGCVGVVSINKHNYKLRLYTCSFNMICAYICSWYIQVGNFSYRLSSLHSLWVSDLHLGISTHCFSEPSKSSYCSCSAMGISINTSHNQQNHQTLKLVLGSSINRVSHNQQNHKTLKLVLGSSINRVSRNTARFLCSHGNYHINIT